MTYILLFLAILLLSFPTAKGRSKVVRLFFLSLSILLLSGFGGLRDPSIGTDVLGYTDRIWNYMHNLHITSDVIFNQLLTEPGFAVFSFLLHEISDNFQFYLFGISLLTTSLFFISGYLLRNKLNYVIYTLVYCLLFYNMSFNIMRQLCSLGFMALMIAMIAKKKYKAAIIPLFLSCVFHNSGSFSIVVYLIFYFYDRRKINTKLTFLIILSGFIGIFYYENIVLWLVSNGFLNTGFLLYTSVGGVFESKLPITDFIIKLYLLFIAIKVFAINSTLPLNKESLLLTSLASISSLTSLVVQFAGRITYPFFIASIMVILIQLKGMKKVYTIIFVMLCIFFWGYTIAYGNSNDTFPYKFYFD